MNVKVVQEDDKWRTQNKNISTFVKRLPSALSHSRKSKKTEKMSRKRNSNLILLIIHQKIMQRSALVAYHLLHQISYFVIYTIVIKLFTLFIFLTSCLFILQKYVYVCLCNFCFYRRFLENYCLKFKNLEAV